MKLLRSHLSRLIALTILVVLVVSYVPLVGAQGGISDAQVVTQFLNMRAQPNAGAALVQQLPKGTLLTVDGRNHDGAWLYAHTNDGGIQGWLMASWLSLRLDMDVNALPYAGPDSPTSPPIAPAPVQAAPEAPAAAPAAAQQVVTDGPVVATASTWTRLNARRGPDTSYGRLGTLPNGAQFGLKGRDVAGFWVYGTSNTGITGWVAAQYLNVELSTVSALPVMDASAPVGVVQAPAAAQPSGGANAAPITSTTPTRGFNLGGQIQGYGAEGWMKTAGMTYVKRQVVYHLGADAGGSAGMIGEAHAHGFRILLSVKGHPGELASDPNYIQNFAGFVGGLAAAGADAIEVWNEMNIDREWPAGRIDPNWYTQMLAASYNAIKSNNSSTMVVSGAPAPTGAEGAFGLDRVWNDSRYIRGMAAAGAANYMDCVGIHYNEGIIGPSQRSGDPRDGYYTRYFWGMVDTYWSAFGGRRPLCFTEIGYLSPEGYGALPGGFAWAGNVTVAQQAAWLGQAASLARGSGRVRLFIVWNVDFTGNWGNDPMGGYAIVRPGGDCPACRALAGG